jgi:hypothetical protein
LAVRHVAISDAGNFEVEGWQILKVSDCGVKRPKFLGFEVLFIVLYSEKI